MHQKSTKDLLTRSGPIAKSTGTDHPKSVLQTKLDLDVKETDLALESSSVYAYIPHGADLQPTSNSCGLFKVMASLKDTLSPPLIYPFNSP